MSEITSCTADSGMSETTSCTADSGMSETTSCTADSGMSEITSCTADSGIYCSISTLKRNQGVQDGSIMVLIVLIEALSDSLLLHSAEVENYCHCQIGTINLAKLTVVVTSITESDTWVQSNHQNMLQAGV